jgi:hypothetical protein
MPSRIRQSVEKETPESLASRCKPACLSWLSDARMSDADGIEDFIAATLSQPEGCNTSRTEKRQTVAARYRFGMAEDLKKTLWENLAVLMDRQWGAANLSRLGREAETGPATPWRLKALEQNVSVDTLEKLAGPFGVEPWQLLAPGLGETMSQPALTIARKFDALPDDRVRLRAYTLIDQALEQARQGESIQGPPPATTPTDEPAADERTRPATAPAKSAPSRTPVKAPPTRAGR